MLPFEATVIGTVMIPLSLSLYFFYLYKLSPSPEAAAPRLRSTEGIVREETPPLPVDPPEAVEETPPLPVQPPEAVEETPPLPVQPPEAVEETPPLPVEPRAVPRKPAVEGRTCPHYIGYLTHLPRGNPFPDECFGCRQVVRCMRIEPAQVVESFYLEAQT